MKALALGCILACGIPMLARADNFNKTAYPGVATGMHSYFGWDPNTCQPLSGVVKLLTKPKHGRLTTRQVDRAIYRSRFATGRFRSVCAGHALKAFAISYTSNPNFHGVDSFSVRATYGWQNRVVIDTFTITVP
jgi:hypothetical protein